MFKAGDTHYDKNVWLLLHFCCYLLTWSSHSCWNSQWKAELASAISDDIFCLLTLVRYCHAFSLYVKCYRFAFLNNLMPWILLCKGFGKGNILYAYIMWFKISRIMRKPVFAVCEQQRRRSACASVQSDQHLCFCCLDSIIPILANSKIWRL